MKNFEKYCTEPENIENYDKAKKNNFKGWDCHHRLETHNSDGERRLVGITKKELIALGIYYNRPAEELIFLTSREHSRLHRKGKCLSEETRNKMREAKQNISEETRKKMSEAKQNISEETRNKMREAKKGKHRSEETRKKIREAHKGKKFSEETKKKLSEARKGRHWYNNGKINIRAKECPEGFVPGMLR